MKAISLWQPWATAVAIGAKKIETRSWPAGYRGALAIHAAKRLNKNKMLFDMCCGHWDAALQSLPGWKERLAGDKHKFLWDLIPFGAIVAVCRLDDVKTSGEFTQLTLDLPRYPDNKPGYQSWTERSMGDFSLGRFGWVLKNIRAITPIPCVGRQGLFNLSSREVDEIMEQGVRLCRYCGNETKTEYVCDECDRKNY